MAEIPLKKIKEIRWRYLGGQPKVEIAKECSVSVPSVEKYINDEGLGKLSVPLESQELYKEIKIENGRIMKLKEKLMKFIEKAIDEAMKGSNKILFLDKVGSILSQLDRIQRLNMDKPTDHTKHTEEKIDYAEIIRELKTPEDKQRFLRSQMDTMRQAKVIDVTPKK